MMSPYRKLAVVLAVLLCPFSANAVLINLGDTTLDTNSGLEWLDVTETAGMSVTDVWSSSLLHDGWQFASIDQFISLATDYVGGESGVSSDNTISLIRGGRAIALLGCTLSVNSDICQYTTTDPSDPVTFAVLGLLDDGNGDPDTSGFGEIVLRFFEDDATITWQTFDDFYDNDRHEPQVGSFLVRTYSVPEPGTLALLSLGLAGMGLARRRRKV